MQGYSGTGIFAHRRRSSPTHGTSKPCQGPDSVGKGIWVLSGQHHHGSGCQALGSWEMHVCAEGMARGRVSPLPGAPLTPLRLRLSGILLFLSFSFQCPAVFLVLGGKKKKVIYCEALAENHFLNHCTILIRRPYCIQSREDLQGG